MVLIVMGVSGCGKTTVGKLLSEALGVPFFDADDFHSEDMVEKMRKGFSLNDKDRDPWLTNLSDHIREWDRSGGAVLACSALKEQYRLQLSSIANERLIWIYLGGSKELIRQRMEQRKGHYFNSALLDSQVEALEIPEYGMHYHISMSPDQIADDIVPQLKN